jgi:hypothetical protein
MESGFFSEKFHGNSRDLYEKGLRTGGAFFIREIMEVSGFEALDQMYKEYQDDLKVLEHEQNATKSDSDH